MAQAGSQGARGSDVHDDLQGKSSALSALLSFPSRALGKGNMRKRVFPPSAPTTGTLGANGESLLPISEKEIQSLKEG